MSHYSEFVEMVNKTMLLQHGVEYGEAQAAIDPEGERLYAAFQSNEAISGYVNAIGAEYGLIRRDGEPDRDQLGRINRYKLALIEFTTGMDSENWRIGQDARGYYQFPDDGRIVRIDVISAADGERLGFSVAEAPSDVTELNIADHDPLERVIPPKVKFEVVSQKGDISDALRSYELKAGREFEVSIPDWRDHVDMDGAAPSGPSSRS